MKVLFLAGLLLPLAVHGLRIAQNERVSQYEEQLQAPSFVQMQPRQNIIPFILHTLFLLLIVLRPASA